jgi:hypothetical protein
LETILGIVLMLIATLTYIEVSSRKRRKAKGVKGKGRRAMGGALFAIDEVFHPSAHESAIIMEDKRIERKALPSPEDKENPAQ